MSAELQILDAVGAETRAWDTQDVELLLGLFHPDMVWPFPPGPVAHDPVTWVWVMGRFDRARWSRIYHELFATHDLVHNVREVVSVSVSREQDAGLAVVDVDTLWRHRTTGAPQHWYGRAGKGWSLCGDRWLMTMHSGLLDYTVVRPG